MKKKTTKLKTNRVKETIVLWLRFPVPFKHVCMWNCRCVCVFVCVWVYFWTGLKFLFHSNLLLRRILFICFCIRKLIRIINMKFTWAYLQTLYLVGPLVNTLNRSNNEMNTKMYFFFLFGLSMLIAVDFTLICNAYLFRFCTSNVLICSTYFLRLGF